MGWFEMVGQALGCKTFFLLLKMAWNAARDSITLLQCLLMVMHSGTCSTSITACPRRGLCTKLIHKLWCLPIRRLIHEWDAICESWLRLLLINEISYSRVHLFVSKTAQKPLFAAVAEHWLSEVNLLPKVPWSWGRQYAAQGSYPNNLFEAFLGLIIVSSCSS
jgi:hypothetical protein